MQADTITTAAAGLVGVIVGGGISWLTQTHAARVRERAAVRRAARLLYADFSYVASLVGEALDRRRWWSQTERPSMNAWRSEKDTLASSRIHDDDWQQVVRTISELRNLRARNGHFGSHMQEPEAEHLQGFLVEVSRSMDILRGLTG